MCSKKFIEISLLFILFLEKKQTAMATFYLSGETSSFFRIQAITILWGNDYSKCIVPCKLIYCFGNTAPKCRADAECTEWTN